MSKFQILRLTKANQIISYNAEGVFVIQGEKIVGVRNKRLKRKCIAAPANKTFYDSGVIRFHVNTVDTEELAQLERVLTTVCHCVIES